MRGRAAQGVSTTTTATATTTRRAARRARTMRHRNCCRVSAGGYDMDGSAGHHALLRDCVACEPPCGATKRPHGTGWPAVGAATRGVHGGKPPVVRGTRTPPAFAADCRGEGLLIRGMRGEEVDIVVPTMGWSPSFARAPRRRATDAASGRESGRRMRNSPGTMHAGTVGS